MPKLIYIDFTFTCVNAHANNFSYALAKQAKDAGIEFIAFATEACTTEKDAEFAAIKPGLTYNCNLEWWLPIIGKRFLLGQLYDLICSNLAVYRSLNKISKDLLRANYILFGTSDFRQLLGIAFWYLANQKIIRSSLSYLTIMEDLDAEINKKALYLRSPIWKLSFYFLRQVAKRTTLSLLSDTIKRVESLKNYSRMRCKLLPFPILVDHALHDQGVNRRPLRALMIGNLREERGIACLLKSITLLKSQLDLELLEFRINLAIPTVHKTIAEFHLHQKLSELINTKGIRISFSALSSTEYQRAIAASDLVLLPYSLAAYKNKSSGILFEALSAAKPVITTHETWMYEQTKDLGLACYFQDGDSRSLASAICKVIEHYDEFSSKAYQYAETYRSNTSHNNTMGLFMPF